MEYLTHFVTLADEIHELCQVLNIDKDRIQEILKSPDKEQKADDLWDEILDTLPEDYREDDYDFWEMLSFQVGTQEVLDGLKQYLSGSYSWENCGDESTD